MENNASSNEGSSQPTPPQQRVRPATSDDISRLALVAMSGFYSAPQFKWERPSHHQYPEDTYRSYVDLLTGCLADPACLVYLAEDAYDPSEHTKTGATIATGDLYREPRAGELVPVGLGVWNLPVDSSRHRLAPASSDTTSEPAPPDPSTTASTSQTRDVNWAHRTQIREKVAELKSRLFSPVEDEKSYAMVMFAVHPAYQGRSHGTALLRFGTRCADEEGRVIRLFSQPKAVPLYERSGFEVLEWAVLVDEEVVGDVGGRFDFAAMRRLPKGS